MSRCNKSEATVTSEATVNCGCFGCLLEVIGFILICYICGCEWARNAIVRVVKDARSVMQEGSAK